MCDETPQERQDNEFAVLKSIYGDDLFDNREAIAWKVWRPLDVQLTLRPLHNSQDPMIYCSITLRFQCCHNYPDKPPLITMCKSEGLSNENETKLVSQLEELAASLCGEVMIYQLSQHTEQFLHENNRPSLSFYDQMMQQKTEMERLKSLDLEYKENEKRQKIKDEIQRRQELLRDAGKKTGQEVENNEGQGDAPKLMYYADNSMSPTKRSSRIVRIEVPCTCESKGAITLRITQRNSKKVYIGKCLSHSSNGSTTYLAIDDETGDRLIAKKWLIPPHSDFQLRTRQMISLRQDLKAMCKVAHKHLVPYVAIEIPKEVARYAPKQSVYVFRDFILGSSLRFFKDKMCVKDKHEVLKVLRHVGLGVLSALKELHSGDVLHRDVRCENVFLDESGGVKLVGAGLDGRLTEMYDGDSYCDKQTQAQDIYATGQMLLSIMCPDDPTFRALPPDLPCSAKDFFSRCLTEDEHTQWTAEQLISHEFLVDKLTKQIDGKKKRDEESGSEDDEPVKPHHSFPANGHSRLEDEFEVLNWLGSGAYGDVLKVKNKLDGGFYAIKRVQLNPENVHLNKKITREVKLLSRLNHENVVRYYNAWIESVIWEKEEESTASVSPKKKSGDSLEDVVAKLGGVKLEWSISEKPVKRNESNPSSDSEDDEDNFVRDREESFDSSDESYFAFARDPEESKSSASTENLSRPKIERLKQVLYIQMEFCEKNTLRQAIDNGLCHDNFRAWRLFREVCEGLAHVHQRGMIHRDLKPVNIFLDSNDHVKIGDFGLATKAFTALSLDGKTSKQSTDAGGPLTGQIGTALYVAPELMEENAQVMYNQKVDIYSLGIILFEMFHEPLDTGMERISILKKLRGKSISLPHEFENKVENIKQIHVIKWLLNHDASIRPTCAELLASEHVPRPVPEGTLSGLLSHTLNDRRSRGYQRLVSACLDQTTGPAEDFTYHQGMKAKPLDVLGELKDAVTKIFRSHGAMEFTPPLLTPRARRWDQHPNVVKVMTASGFVCHLPHDLRLPFARHIAYTGTKYLRRYVIDRVFRDRHAKEGFHPREMHECAFDIITPRPESLWSDAELLVVASRAASACQVKVSIQLNHTQLLSTLLESCGVPEDKHLDIYRVLVEVSSGHITNLQLQTHLTSLCVTAKDVTNLLEIMEIDHPVYELRGLLMPKVRQDKWGQAAERAMDDLEAVHRNAVALGCECPISVVPFLAYNATQHSGVFWLMSVQRDDYPGKPGKLRPGDLIAAGGRYDVLVAEFSRVAASGREMSEMQCSAVGFSMSLERIAALLKKSEPMPLFVNNIESTLINVCLWGSGPAADRRARVARELWAAGLRCAGAPGEAGGEEGGARAVLRGDDCLVSVVMWGEGDNRIREHRVPYTEVVEFLKLNLVRSDGSAPSRTISWCEDKSTGPSVSVTYVAEEKITKSLKRYCEIQINTQLSCSLAALGVVRARVLVAAAALDAGCVRALAAHLAAPLDAAALPGAFAHVAAMFMKRQNILNDVLEELTSLVKNPSKSSDEVVLYAIYSIPDCVCKLIT